MSETHITPLVTAIDRLTQAINLLAEFTHNLGEQRIVRRQLCCQLEEGVAPLGRLLEDLRAVREFRENLGTLFGTHHDSSTPAGPESPSGLTVEDPGHPGADSHPDARNGGDLS